MLRIADERITAVTDSPISQNLIELPCVSKAQVFPDFPFVIFNDCWNTIATTCFVVSTISKRDAFFFLKVCLQSNVCEGFQS